MSYFITKGKCSRSLECGYLRAHFGLLAYQSLFLASSGMKKSIKSYYS